MKEDLKRIIEAIVPDIDWDEEDLDFNELLDSMDLIELMAEIEDYFNISIDMNLRTAKNFKNLESLCEMIESLI